MTMRLVCDHCEGVINEAEFAEEQRSIMARSLDDPTGGTARTMTESFHYHMLCAEARIRAAERAPLSSSPEPVELPDDHPLAQVEREAGVVQQEQIRTGEAEVRPLTGEQLHEKTVEELHEIAAHLDVSGRSEMRKDDLVEAIVEAQSAG